MRSLLLTGLETEVWGQDVSRFVTFWGCLLWLADGYLLVTSHDFFPVYPCHTLDKTPCQVLCAWKVTGPLGCWTPPWIQPLMSSVANCGVRDRPIGGGSLGLTWKGVLLSQVLLSLFSAPWLPWVGSFASCTLLPWSHPTIDEYPTHHESKLTSQQNQEWAKTWAPDSTPASSTLSPPHSHSCHASTHFLEHLPLRVPQQVPA